MEANIHYLRNALYGWWVEGGGADKRYVAEGGLCQRYVTVKVLLFKRKLLHYLLLKLSTQRLNKLTKRNCEV